MNAVADAQPWRSIVNPDDVRFLNPESMSDAIRKYCQETQQPAPESLVQLVRCVVDSLSLSYRFVKEQLESLLGRNLTGIRIVGGGTKNGLLNQLCANACQLPVSAGPVEASAIGNVCAQMIGLGEIADLAEARSLIRRSFPISEYLPNETTPDGVWERFQQLLAMDFKEQVL
jgi:rhamnulokinase